MPERQVLQWDEMGGICVQKILSDLVGLYSGYNLDLLCLVCALVQWWWVVNIFKVIVLCGCVVLFCFVFFSNCWLDESIFSTIQCSECLHSKMQWRQRPCVNYRGENNINVSPLVNWLLIHPNWRSLDQFKVCDPIWELLLSWNIYPNLMKGILPICSNEC